MELMGWMVGVLVVAVFGSAILFTWAMCRSSAMRDDDMTTLEHKRQWEGLHQQPATLSGRAAKGFDRTIGRDQVSRAERKRWIN
jgi:hypothetical protein